jgi:hypothetical protein
MAKDNSIHMAKLDGAAQWQKTTAEHNCQTKLHSAMVIHNGKHDDKTQWRNTMTDGETKLYNTILKHDSGTQ